MKPSSDYIDWMMAPEREAFRRRLNEEWEPEVGDWIVTADDPKTPQIVTVSADEGVYRTAKTRRELWEYRQHIRWLPGLGQLLGMIEEAHEPGYGFYKRYARDGGGYAAYAKDHTASVAEKGPEIAAASLLAKLWGMQ